MGKGMIAFVFAGQGAQFSGMGKTLYETSAAARRVFDICDSIRPGTAAQCFEGSDDELKETKNTQPCMFAVEMAAAEALREAGITADLTAGFSLGEIGALTYSGAVSTEDGFKIVCKRAELMQAAAEKVDTSMAAVVKLSKDKVEEICAAHEQVYPVNYNCPGQISCAGLSSSMADFAAAVKAAGGRAIPLKVKGGFHSPFMKEASEGFAAVLDKIEIGEPEMPLYSNKTGKVYESGTVRELLAAQISSPVKWEEIVRDMISKGADTFVEIGPGATLSGLIAKTDSTVKTLQAGDAESLRKTAAEIKGV